LIVIVCKDCVDKTIPTTLIAVALVFILIVLLKEESINLLKKMSRNSKIHQYLNPNIEILIYLKLFLLLKIAIILIFDSIFGILHFIVTKAFIAYIIYLGIYMVLYSIFILNRM